ncbi:MAG: hypothetical protein U1E70_07170 [Acetobacteraceae bacterium]
MPLLPSVAMRISGLVTAWEDGTGQRAGPAPPSPDWRGAVSRRGDADDRLAAALK